ncbi:hypothetical protein [Peloplasma aerotolerans]|uniref:Uncharacterized protein n=1 Tax=Peloplasma aerotolerans TaxID=3044389 RepID=A0AAW6UAQ7_9MOLU|nr:hypothetical protein [Mariniplasma sp. M4Ah]MDI6453191.1 hypothetical protein [Mariniplasma sp. M4Ah]
MKYKIVDTFPNDFFNNKKAPLFSIYQETSRHLTENKRDALVFKNLIKEVEGSLREKYDKKEIKPLMEMFSEIENASTFWSHTYDGIALFASLDECIIYNLKKPISTLAVVSDTFHIKPLIHYFQIAQTYQILDLDAHSFQLFEGTPYHIEKIELSDSIQTTKDEILGTEKTDPYQTHGTYGGSSGKSTFHGHGGKKAEDEIDLERFFRQVDLIIDENISKKSKCPLILLAPTEYHALFLEMSNNLFLEPKAISGSYDTLGKEETKKQIELLNIERLNQKTEKLINQYHQLRPSEKSSDQLIEIISAVIDGRVETLFIELDKIIPGHIDLVNKKMKTKDLANPEIDDILDDLAQYTLEKNGHVYILSKEDMPTESGAAAIYRY